MVTNKETSVEVYGKLPREEKQIRYRILRENEISDLRKMLEVANLEEKQAEREEEAKQVEQKIGVHLTEKYEKGIEIGELDKQRQEVLNRTRKGGNPSLCDGNCPMAVYLWMTSTPGTSKQNTKETRSIGSAGLWFQTIPKRRTVKYCDFKFAEICIILVLNLKGEELQPCRHWSNL